MGHSPRKLARTLPKVNVIEKKVKGLFQIKRDTDVTKFFVQLGKSDYELDIGLSSGNNFFS